MGKSADAQAIRASVQRRGIHEVYHYSPLSQMPGILAFGGIHSRVELRRRGIAFNDDPSRWSNDPVKAQDLASFVAVGVFRPYGMMKRDPWCVVFGISTSVLFRPDTCFIGTWSSSGTIGGRNHVRTKRGIASFDAMFDNPYSSFPTPQPGEILIEGSINLSEITSMYVKSDDHFRMAKREISQSSYDFSGVSIGFKARVKPRIFGVRE